MILEIQDPHGPSKVYELDIGDKNPHSPAVWQMMSQTARGRGLTRREYC